MQRISGKARIGSVKMYSGEPDQMRPKSLMQYVSKFTLFIFPENVGNVSAERGDRFHQDIASNTKKFGALLCWLTVRNKSVIHQKCFIKEEENLVIKC